MSTDTCYPVMCQGCYHSIAGIPLYAITEIGEAVPGSVCVGCEVPIKVKQYKVVVGSPAIVAHLETDGKHGQGRN